MRVATAKQVASLLQRTIRSLQNMEKNNIGPKPFRLNKSVLYDLDEVEAYLAKLKKDQSKKQS